MEVKTASREVVFKPNDHRVAPRGVGKRVSVGFSVVYSDLPDAGTIPMGILACAGMAWGSGGIS